jgi:hypothetical protein
MPEMTIGVKIGMTVLVAALIALLVAYHWLFTPPPAHGTPRNEPEDARAPRADEVRTATPSLGGRRS